MLIGCLPFNVNSKESDIIHQILNEPTPYPNNQWKKISMSGKNFVSSLLQKNPNKRLNVKEALEHEWIAGENSDLKSKTSDLKKVMSPFAIYSDSRNYKS